MTALWAPDGTVTPHPNAVLAPPCTDCGHGTPTVWWPNAPTRWWLSCPGCAAAHPRRLTLDLGDDLIAQYVAWVVTR